MRVMPRRKKTPKPTDDRPKPNRTGVPLYVYVSDELGAAIEKYLEESMPRISKTSAVEAAMMAFLKEKGHWPPAPGTGTGTGTAPQADDGADDAAEG